MLRRFPLVLVGALAASFVLGAVAETKIHFSRQIKELGGRVQTFAASPYYRTKTDVFKSLPLRSGDIVFVGDSITGLAELQELFVSARVKNRGINGDTTAGVLNRLPQIYEGQPAAVFILCGINNLQGGMPVGRTVEDLQRILETLSAKSPGTAIFVQGLLPVNAARYTAEILASNSTVAIPDPGDVLRINEELKRIVPKIPNARYVSLGGLLDARGELRGDLTEDGLHLNGKGLIAWADLLKVYVDGAKAKSEPAAT